MRCKAETHFARICRFLDTDQRRCTIYAGLPSVCRTFPGGRCGYCDFLASERNMQGDSEHIATRWRA